MSREDLVRRLITCGDAKYTTGWYVNAIELYKAAGAKLQLIACGDLCLQCKQNDSAMEAYAAAGASEKLLNLAEIALGLGHYLTSLAAYKAAGEEKDVEFQMGCGDAYIALGQYTQAGLVFRAALKCLQ